jgi:hypothetical protein
MEGLQERPDHRRRLWIGEGDGVLAGCQPDEKDKDESRSKTFEHGIAKPRRCMCPAKDGLAKALKTGRIEA